VNYAEKFLLLDGYRKCFVTETTQLVSLAKLGLVLVSGRFKEESMRVVWSQSFTRECRQVPFGLWNL
jgi:hypothetical protein